MDGNMMPLLHHEEASPVSAQMVHEYSAADHDWQLHQRWHGPSAVQPSLLRTLVANPGGSGTPKLWFSRPQCCSPRR